MSCDEQTKYCGRCKKQLPITCFAKNSAKKDGLQERCSSCRREHYQDRRVDISRKRREEYSTEKSWEKNIKYSYGITRTEFIDILASQGNVCAICGSSDWGRGKATNKPHIDHCHTTGKVRGLLCNTCNRALGMLQDDVKVIRNAAVYLEKHYGV